MTIQQYPQVNVPVSFYYPLAVSDLSELEVKKISNQVNYSNQYWLILILSGSCELLIMGERFTLRAGDIAHFHASSAIRFDNRKQLKGIWIQFTSTDGSEQLKPPYHNGHLITNAKSRLLHQAEQLLELWKASMVDSPFTLQLSFTALLMEIHEHVQSIKQQENEEWLPKIVANIGKHYRTTITRKHLAALAGVSPEHFSRVFRKEMGQTFTSYVNLLRIRKAQEILLTTSSSLSQLAPELGYEEGTYLSRKFKQVVGTSPTLYIRKEKKIVSLNYNYTACLRALDIMPALAPYSQWLMSREQIQPSQLLSIERQDLSKAHKAVSAAQPDVIVNYCIEQENSLMLPIAPVIAIPFQKMNWKEQFSLIGEVVNRRKEVNIWLQKYEQLCLQLNNSLNKQYSYRGTAIVWEFGEQSVYCFHASYGRGCHLLYGELNYQIPDQLLTENIIEQGYLEKKIEHIPFYPADTIIFTNSPKTIACKQSFNRLKSSIDWNSLEAVRNKRVYILNHSAMFYGFDPISSVAQLDILHKALTSQMYNV